VKIVVLYPYNDRQSYKFDGSKLKYLDIIQKKEVLSNVRWNGNDDVTVAVVDEFHSASIDRRIE